MTLSFSPTHAVVSARAHLPDFSRHHVRVSLTRLALGLAISLPAGRIAARPTPVLSGCSGLPLSWHNGARAGAACRCF